MDKNLLIPAVFHFSNTQKEFYTQSYTIPGNTKEVFTVTIARKEMPNLSESISLESRSFTISALPSGEACDACGGSGRSR